MNVRSLNFFALVFFNIVGQSFCSQLAKGVELKVGKVIIGADRISLENGKIKADGNIRCTGEKFYARCGSLECDMKSQEVFAKNAEMNIDSASLSAQSVIFSENMIIFYMHR